MRYWNLFSGGDGSNMIALLDAFREADPDIAVKDSTLQLADPGARAAQCAAPPRGREQPPQARTRP